MTDGQAVDTPKKRKGLLAFYVATGFLALLFVGFYFAWTPLRVLYWERKVRTKPRSSSGNPQGAVVQDSDARVLAAIKLAKLGTAARSAFRRLLNSPDMGVRTAALFGLRDSQPSWALPLLVEVCSDKDQAVVCHALWAAEDICGRQFGPAQEFGPRGNDAPLKAARRNFLDWWNREGKAKYGRGVE